MIETDRPPYPGLRPFNRDESELFFGRGDCVEAMRARLEKTRFLAVLGSSGTGKSSLVKCGLLPALDAQPVAAKGWWFVDFRPGGDALKSLAEGLLRGKNGGATLSRTEVDQLKARFKQEGPRELMKWCSEGNLDAGSKLLLVVDQFEELFRYRDSEQREEVQAFISLLLESRWPRRVKSPDQAPIPIYVIITMRSEYLGACALMLGLAEAINEGAYLTPRMTREQCEDAIVGPALVCEFEIERRLVTRLLNDMADFAPWEGEADDKDQLSRLARQADQLPLMQYALNQMWKRARENEQSKPQEPLAEGIRLELANYLGLERELDRNGDKVYQALPDDLKPIAETIFRAVTAGTTVANATRHPTKLGDLINICGDGRDDDVAAVIEAFGPDGSQFLTTDVARIDGRFPKTAWIDIAHESLIRQWKKLSTWLEAEGVASHEWQRLKEDAGKGRLLYGARLADAVKLRRHVEPAWAKRYGGDYDKIVGLITKSIWLKWLRWGSAAVVAVGATIGGVRYLQQAAVAEHNYKVAIRSGSELANQLSASVEHGDMTLKGASDMLRVTNQIVERMQGKVTTDNEVMLIDLLCTVSDILDKLGKYKDALSNATTAKDKALQLTKWDADNPAVVRALYESLWRAGDTLSLFEKDPWGQTWNNYSQAETQAHRLSKLTPQDSTVDGKLSFIHQKLGDVLMMRKRYGEGIDRYNMSLNIVQAALAKNPRDLEWQRQLAITKRRLGNARTLNQDIDGGLQDLNAALEILTRLAQDVRGDVTIQSNLAANHLEIADVMQKRLKAFSAALAETQKAINIQEGLMDRDPGNASSEFSLASAYRRAGAISEQLDDPDAALSFYKMAYSYRQKLANKDPANQLRQMSAATAAITVADLLVLHKRDPEQAARLYNEAISSLEEPAPSHDLIVFDCYMKIGDIFFFSGLDPPQGLKEYTLASGIAQQAVDKDGTSEQWKKNLQQSFNKVSEALVSLQRTPESYRAEQESPGFCAENCKSAAGRQLGRAYDATHGSDPAPVSKFG